jgi:hypothetical protein
VSVLTSCDSISQKYKIFSHFFFVVFKDGGVTFTPKSLISCTEGIFVW